MTFTTYGIDGLDRLGKSTLIDGIRNELGYFEVIHFQKPQVLKAYELTKSEHPPVPKNMPLYHYQAESFRNSMLIAKSGARVIFDRWHLGEAVYAPLYRGYSGDFVFDQERQARLDLCENIKLILLTEDFFKSTHFVDDGKSLGAAVNRPMEQHAFVNAFNKSIVKNKKIICVTDPNTGKFKHKDDILAEALA